MDFNIRRNQSQDDIDFLCSMSFQTAKHARDIHYTSLKEKHPDKSEDEIFELFRDELMESYDFSRDDCRIYIVDDENGVRIGYVWVAIRDSEDSWDLDRPLWIYDISVLPEYRRRGLAKMLLLKAEEYAKELGKNIGLFVHEHNTGAINLYKSLEYEVKATPTSVILDDSDQIQISLQDYVVQDIIDINDNRIWDINLETFKRLVRYSKDASDDEVEQKFRENRQKYDLQSEKYASYLVLSPNDEIVGFVLVGVSYFSDDIGMIYELAIDKEMRNEELERLLVNLFKKWSADKGLSRLYILLHSQWNLSIETCREMGFKIPGYFMEKRLV